MSTLFSLFIFIQSYKDASSYFHELSNQYETWAHKHSIMEILLSVEENTTGQSHKAKNFTSTKVSYSQFGGKKMFKGKNDSN